MSRFFKCIRGWESVFWAIYLLIAFFVFVFPNVWLGNVLLIVTCYWFCSRIFGLTGKCGIRARFAWGFSWALLVFSLSFFAYIPIEFLQLPNGALNWNLARYLDLTLYLEPVGEFFHPEAFAFEPVGIPGEVIVETISIFRTDYYQYPNSPVPSYPNLMRLVLSSFCLLLALMVNMVVCRRHKTRDDEQFNQRGNNGRRRRSRKVHMTLNDVFWAPTFAMFALVCINSRNAWLGTGFMFAILMLAVFRFVRFQSTTLSKARICMLMTLLTLVFGFYFQRLHYIPYGKGSMTVSASFRLPYKLYCGYLEFVEPGVMHPVGRAEAKNMLTEFSGRHEGFITSFHFSVPSLCLTGAKGQRILFSHGNFLNWIRCGVSFIVVTLLVGIRYFVLLFKNTQNRRRKWRGH